jgi:hypothetical protein
LFALTMNPTNDEIVVFTPYFAARTPERQAELDHCLAKNLDCDAIHRLVLLIDDGHEPPLRHPKLVTRRIGARPTYRQWIEFGRELCPGRISILANSDIYFDDSLRLVRETLNGTQRFLALTRLEKQGDRLVPHASPHWSQDTWGLRADQALPDPLLKALDIPLGVPRCDNKVAYLFAVHGWTVHNPNAFVLSVHVHETQQRHYDKKADTTVLGGVAYVEPAASIAAPSRLEFDVWARNAHLVKDVRLNRSLDQWLKDARRDDPAPQPPPTIGGTPRPQSVQEPAKAALSSGDKVVDVLNRFRIYRDQGSLIAVDVLSPTQARRLEDSSASPSGDPGLLLRVFVPPVVDTSPLRIGDRPRTRNDCHFWQYPATTERQAHQNHLRLPAGSNLDVAGKVVHTYLGLPWATYIDRKQWPQDVERFMHLRLDGLRRLAAEQGYDLRVHTVCQQIHWRRAIGSFVRLGVTDLHLCHAEASIDPQAEGWPLRIHSWPLIAPNIEDPGRRDGLVIGKPVGARRWLASFIGAHMPHYRSDVRLRLHEAARASGRADVLVDLGQEWHFNKVVYAEQVANKTLGAAETAAHDAGTQRYNAALSDSVFSLCPEGAGPNTLRVWESLAVGAVPVIFAPGWVPPPVDGHPGLAACALFIDESPSPALFERLAAMPRAEVERMQRDGMALYELMRQRTAFPSS